MAKFQINCTITLSSSKGISDQEFQSSLDLGSNEGVGFDVAAMAKAITEALEAAGVMAAHRSQAGNMTVSLPIKVEGSGMVKKTSLVGKKVGGKMTDEEKKARLLQELGIL